MQMVESSYCRSFFVVLAGTEDEYEYDGSMRLLLRLLPMREQFLL
jgi:hypothetical protein